jgi:hypothetical protein
MQRRLLYKFVDWQDKCDEVDGKSFSPSLRPPILSQRASHFKYPLLPVARMCIAPLPRRTIRCFEDGLPTIEGLRVTGV